MIDEKIYIDQAKEGDMNAFRQLVENHKVRLYNLAYDLTGNRHDAEDLSQDVFIKVFNSLHKYRGESKFSSWLYRITVNTWINMRKSKHYKAQKMTEELQEEHFLMNTNSIANPEKDTESILIQNSIQSALSGLSPREKSIFVLRHYNDLKIADISKSLGISVGSVKTLLFRAIKKMQKNLSYYTQEFGLEDLS